LFKIATLVSVDGRGNLPSAMW